MSAVALRPLEEVRIVTVLGIRFWDAARDSQVSDGLVVSARAEGTTAPRVTAFRTLSGVYAFQGLPGLHDLEYPPPGATPAASPPLTARLIVEVEDTEDRFVPVAFAVEVPLPYRGVLTTAVGGSPPAADVPGFYLFSAPSRPAPLGLAVVRAELVDAVSGAPAAHAVLEVERPDGELAYGLAGAQGRVVAFMPYPMVITTLGASPPAPPVPLAGQRWPLVVRVRYAPARLVHPAGSTVPELGSVFHQAPAVLAVGAAGSGVPEHTVELAFGRELVLRSENRSTLLVEPGPSSP